MNLSTSKSFTHKAKDYTSFYNEFGEPRVNIEGIIQVADSKGNTIDLNGGSGGAGGGSIVYTNASNDFIATINVGTKTITITGLSFQLDLLNIVAGSIKRISAPVLGISTTTILSLENVGLSGNVITINGIDDFAAGETVLVTFIGPDKAYDRQLDVQKVVVQNPEYAHTTDPELIVDVANVAANKYFVEIPASNFKNLNIQVVATDSVGFTTKLYETNDSAAVVPADGGTPGATWTDVSTATYGVAVLGGDAITSVNESKHIINRMPLKYLLEYQTRSAVPTNDVEVRIKRY